MNITLILGDRSLRWNVEAYSTEHESLGSFWTTIRPQKSPISCTSGIWLVHSRMPEESWCWLRTPASAERIINLKPRDVVALTLAHEDRVTSTMRSVA